MQIKYIRYNYKTINYTLQEQEAAMRAMREEQERVQAQLQEMRAQKEEAEAQLQQALVEKEQQMKDNLKRQQV